jgi:hypothetical protein
MWQKLVLPLYARKRRTLMTSHPPYTAAEAEPQAQAAPPAPAS